MGFHRWAWWSGSAIGLLLIAAMLVPLIPSNEWWIRAFDVPRTQIAALLAILMFGIGAASMRRISHGAALIRGGHQGTSAGDDPGRA